MINRIKFDWFDNKKVVADLGKVTIIVGENGSGKTTLLKKIENLYLNSNCVDVIFRRPYGRGLSGDAYEKMVSFVGSVSGFGEGSRRLQDLIHHVMSTDKNKGATILMDCPEAYLSIEWQKNLIDWLLECNPNTQLIIATHSPFIFDNKWSDCVFGISEFIKSK